MPRETQMHQADQTRAFFVLMREIILALAIRVGLYWTTYMLAVPASNVMEKGTTVKIYADVAYSYSILVVFIVFHFAEVSWEGDELFERWIGMLQRPLTAFESLNIRGKQLASFLYFTHSG